MKINLIILLIVIFNCQLALSQNQPYIIFILTDDMGMGDVACNGGKLVSTPNIDALAKTGIRFTRYYSGSPICSPSRVSLLTGMHPAKWNITTFLNTRDHNLKSEQANYLDPRAPSIARFFKQGGYKTGHFGKWHMGGGRDVKDATNFEKYGFDEHASTYESPDPDPLLTVTNWWIWSAKDSIKRWDRTAYFVDRTLAFFKKTKERRIFNGNMSVIILRLNTRAEKIRAQARLFYKVAGNSWLTVMVPVRNSTI